MKKMIFRLGLMGIALLGAFLVNPPKAEAATCRLVRIIDGGNYAIYNCDGHEITVMRPKVATAQR